MRIIPKLDIKSNNLVKGCNLEGLRVLGKPEVFAKYYYDNGADELIYQDVVASLFGRNALYEIITKTAKEVFIPLTVGGGISSLDDVKKILRCGADKVAINTAAIKNPSLIKDMAHIFGSSTIVLSIEAMRELLNEVKEEYVLYLEDDHYVFPNGIAKCAKFLSKNPSYRAEHGVSIVADVGKKFPSIKYMNHYMMWGNQACHLKSRLKKINKTGLTYFSVRRTGELMEDLNDIGSYSDQNFDELLVNHLSIIKGRVKKISTLFLKRPYPRPKRYNIPKAFDWVGNENWVKAYDIYVRSIQSILKLHGLDNRAAISWQEKILSEYMVIRFGGRLKSLRNKILNLYNKTILKFYILTLLVVNYKYLAYIKQI